MAGLIKCTYLDCHQTFQNEKAMKLHKKTDDKHDYCRRCDYDAEDWDDLLAHKVDAMAPYVIGDRRFDKIKEPKHIVCEFCGEEFKSFGGRERHRNQQHQAEQNIVCRATQPVGDEQGSWTSATCGKLFLRPSALIHHYESGDCDFVTPKRFEALCHQRYIVQQIWQDHTHFLDIINNSKAVQSQSILRHDSDDSDYEEDDCDLNAAPSGGIRLDLTPCAATPQVDVLSSDDKDQTLHIAAMKPKPGLNVMDMNLPMTRPKPFGSEAGHVADLGLRMGRATLSDSSSTRAQSIVPRQGPSSTFHSANLNSGLTHDAPWLQPKALSDYMVDPAAVSDATAQTRKGDSVNNVWYSGFWDPENKAEFNIDYFFHELIQKYLCPFPNCNAAYLVQSSIEDHLRNAHKPPHDHCPSCYKRFKSVAAIVAHFEASQRGGARRCIVARRSDYKSLLYNVTGGFLSGAHVHDDGVAGIKAKYVRAGGQRVLKLVKVDDVPPSGVDARGQYRLGGGNDRGDVREASRNALAKAGRGVMKFRYDAKIPEGADKNLPH